MKSESYPTVRIPRTVCPDMKAGQKLTLTIVDVGEDEYEVRYASGSKEKMDDEGMGVVGRYNERLKGEPDGGSPV